MSGFNRQSGFSFFEVMIALAFVGIIAVMTVPKAMMAVQGDSQLVKAKSMASVLQTALARYRAANPSDAFVTGRAYPSVINGTTNSGYLVISQSKYLNTDNSGFPFTTAATTGCGNTVHLCYKQSDGSVVRFLEAYVQSLPVSFPSASTHDVNTMVFLYDPDGDGPQDSLTLMMDFDTGRIVPQTAFLDDPANPGTPIAYGGAVPVARRPDDPVYVSKWTKQ